MNNNLELSDLEELFLNFHDDDILICKFEVNVIDWIKSYTGDPSWKLTNENHNYDRTLYCLENEFKDLAELIIFERGFISLDINGKPIFYENFSKIKSGSARARYFNLLSGDEITIN